MGQKAGSKLFASIVGEGRSGDARVVTVSSPINDRWGRRWRRGPWPVDEGSPSPWKGGRGRV